MHRRMLRAGLAGLLALVAALSGLASRHTGPLDFAVPQTEAADSVVMTCDFATLVAEIATVQATGGGTLIFECAETVNFTAAIDITTDVTISGGGVVFDGGSPFFNVASGSTLTLVDLTLQNGLRSEAGDVTTGGAIYSEGDLNIFGVTFHNNELQNVGTGTVRGAAIYTTGATLIVGSTFTDNAGGGNVVQGGAIASFHAADDTLTIISTIFDGNHAVGDQSAMITGAFGGAIYAANPISVNASTFLNNSATDSQDAGGGAIFLISASSSVISNSTFVGNSALIGGGIFLQEASLDVLGSTFAANSAGAGGAVNTLGGAGKQFNILSSTFAGNQATGGGAVSSFQGPTTITILGSTFKDNESVSVGSTLYINDNAVDVSIGGSIIDSTGVSTDANCDLNNTNSTITSLDYNISNDTSCNLTGTNDQPNTDPLLDATLADHGGPTDTYFLQAGSPALDSIATGACGTSSTAVDQRGVSRPVNSACDAGAVEMAGVPPVQIHAVWNTGPVLVGDAAEVFIDASGSADAGLTYEFDCDNDGIYEIGPDLVNSADCVFEDAGAYAVGVRVMDGDIGEAIGSTVVLVTNRPPTIIAITAAPDTINETESTTLTVEYSDADAGETHTCSIDWGDGTAPEAGVIDHDAETCMASHTYADDNPSGTPSDNYTITATVDDGDGSDDDSTQITVNNVPPMIDAITTDGPVAPGQPVAVSVTATDVAGINDPLTYEFDCDGDGLYDIGPQAASSAACSLPSGSAETDIGVRVTDDDTGTAIESVAVKQVVTLCVSSFTGMLSGQSSGGGCAAGEYALELPSAAPQTLCINLLTGQILFGRSAECARYTLPHVIPDDGPLEYCRSLYTNRLRYFTPSKPCQFYELSGVIPGTL